MEEIIKQSFTYANIRLYKNYSNRFDKLKTYEAICLNEKSKKKTKYFYTTTPTSSFIDHRHPGEVVKFERIPLVNIKGTKEGFFETIKDDKIKKYYGDPFASIEIIKIERRIQKDGNKITMKLYFHKKKREVNDIYFKKSANSTTIIFNMKTGNFMTVGYNRINKKLHKKFYTNSYLSLKTSLDFLYRPENKMDYHSLFFHDFKNEFRQDMFQSAVRIALDFDNISYNNVNVEIMINDFCERWLNKFAEIKKIKCPDEGKLRWLRSFYPTERYLKKNKRKLVAAVLDRFNVKSNITIKILHMNPFINMNGLVNLCKLLGENYPKYIGNVNPLFFADIDKYSTTVDTCNKHNLLEETVPHLREVSECEKENMIRIINDTIDDSARGQGVISSFMDHFEMLEKTHPYYPEIRLTARTRESFFEEHITLSNLARQIKTGYSTHLLFDSEVIQEIEKPIQISYLPSIYRVNDFVGNFDGIYEKTFTPYLLKTSEDYYDEGMYMHHCVYGYIDHSHKSIIISLRCGSDRVTCEFDIKSKKCQQSRYFTNDPSPQYFDKALTALKHRISKISYQIAPIDKRKIPLMVNGVEVQVEEIEEQLF